MIGLNYNSIYACYNGRVLFKGELSNAIACPKCRKSLYVEGSKSVPYKVFHHFPLIPCLQRMYRCLSLIELMPWHNVNKSNDDMVLSVCDSKTRQHIDNTWLDFATNLHNIRLGLALDGVNMYVDLSTNHSTWSILLLHYNLPL